MNTTAQIIQKIILLQTGAPGIDATRTEMLQQFEQTGDFTQIAASVEAFMTQRLLENEKGLNGVIQDIAKKKNNGSSRLINNKPAYLIHISRELLLKSSDLTRYFSLFPFS